MTIYQTFNNITKNTDYTIYIHGLNGDEELPSTMLLWKRMILVGQGLSKMFLGRNYQIIWKEDLGCFFPTVSGQFVSGDVGGWVVSLLKRAAAPPCWGGSEVDRASNQADMFLRGIPSWLSLSSLGGRLFIWIFPLNEGKKEKSKTWIVADPCVYLSPFSTTTSY